MSGQSRRHHELLIVYNFGDETRFFEKYLLRDDAIIVGAADDLASLEELMAHLRNF